MNPSYEKKYGAKEFKPTDHSKLPFKVVPSMIWNKVIDATGKTVCNCRNIKDAELIVKMCNP